MDLLRFKQAALMVAAPFLIPASFAQATGGDKVDLERAGPFAWPASSLVPKRQF
jgi:hypothetical protein